MNWPDSTSIHINNYMLNHFFVVGWEEGREARRNLFPPTRLLNLQTSHLIFLEDLSLPARQGDELCYMSQTRLYDVTLAVYVFHLFTGWTCLLSIPKLQTHLVPTVTLDVKCDLKRITFSSNFFSQSLLCISCVASEMTCTERS